MSISIIFMNFWLVYKMSENIEYPHHIFNSSKLSIKVAMLPNQQSKILLVSIILDKKNEYFPDVKIHHWIML